MNLFDRLLQRWRIAMAVPYLSASGRVLDLGCHQGELFKTIEDRLKFGIGMDPLAIPGGSSRFVLLPIPFQGCLPFATHALDAVVMLATLEHILDKDILASECHRVLHPGGRVVITVPDVKVDQLVDLLVRLHILHGMSLDEHHGFQAQDTSRIFCRHGFAVEVARSFQMKMNYLYVFRNLP
jgi:SAM-dependent methyltransferase